MRLVHSFPLSCLVISVLVFSTLLLFFFTADLNEQVRTYINWEKPVLETHNSSWHGWSGVERLFIFGDSESTTNFDINGRQPSQRRPMGNPEDVGRDHVSSWPFYLTTEFNESLVQTYNLADYGSIVDVDLLRNGEAGDFTGAVADKFAGSYFMADVNFVGWTAANSLFAVWFGVNDVNVMVHAQDMNRERYVDAMTEVQIKYRDNLEMLYQLGARNFLLINVPPLTRGPIGNGTDIDVFFTTAIELWNTGLASVKAEFETAHPDATTFLFDAHTFFTTAIEAPATFPETRQLKKTSTACDAYSGSVEKMAYERECGAPYRNYLWRDQLHFTFTMHRAIAGRIAALLSGGESSRVGELKMQRHLPGRRLAG